MVTSIKESVLVGGGFEAHGVGKLRSAASGSCLQEEPAPQPPVPPDEAKAGPESAGEGAPGPQLPGRPKEAGQETGAAERVVQTKFLFAFLELGGNLLAPMAAGLLKAFLAGRAAENDKEIKVVAAALAPQDVRALSAAKQKLWFAAHPWAIGLCKHQLESGVDLSKQPLSRLTPKLLRRVSQQSWSFAVVMDGKKVSEKEALETAPELKGDRVRLSRWRTLKWIESLPTVSRSPALVECFRALNKKDRLTALNDFLGEPDAKEPSDPWELLSKMPQIIRAVGDSLSEKFEEQEVLKFFARK